MVDGVVVGGTLAERPGPPPDAPERPRPPSEEAEAKAPDLAPPA
jgi:hypothetical protein